MEQKSTCMTEKRKQLCFDLYAIVIYCYLYNYLELYMTLAVVVIRKSESGKNQIFVVYIWYTYGIFVVYLRYVCGILGVYLTNMCITVNQNKQMDDATSVYFRKLSESSGLPHTIHRQFQSGTL